MITMKFGGTSLEDVHSISSACTSIADERRDRLIIVSACAGVTNRLIQIATKASKRDESQALVELEEIQTRHLEIAKHLLKAPAQTSIQISNYFDEIRQLIHGVATLQELTPRTLDQFMSYGERCSSLLVFRALEEAAIECSLIEASKIIVTNEEFGHATPLFKSTKRKARTLLLPLLKKGHVVITQGFIAGTREGVTTTLGRGGSDYSAAILGSVLDAEEIQIWTDVQGILTADPSILPDARPIPEMSFNEASELAYFGARVLHPSTILPAVKKNIPVRVLNSRQSKSSGTLITSRITNHSGRVIKAIAYKEGITVVRVTSTHMLMAYGFLSRLSEVFARHKKIIDLVTTSLVGVLLAIHDAGGLDKIVSELEEFSEVKIERNKAICCVVGEGLKSTKGIAGRLFSALDRAGVNVEMISQGGSDINLTFVINEKEVNQAVRSLHTEFFS
jgi:aspartate kinase